MGTVSKLLDENLSRLAWSLWTELGIAGLERKHESFSVPPEELIILTSALSKFDPRLFDEALDWCIRYHHFISPIRLQILAKKYREFITEAFSTFSATVNAIATIRTKWIVLKEPPPLKFRPSGKSILRSFEALSMIHFRLRSLLGVGARADVVAFLLSEEPNGFTVSDLIETGYSKRRLAQILDDLTAAGIFSKTMIRNQWRYAFTKRDQFIQLLGGVPENMVHWHRILAILLPIRGCLLEVEDTPLGVRVIDMRNLLDKLKNHLIQLRLPPPSCKRILRLTGVA